jgi:hypothetical protein
MQSRKHSLLESVTNIAVGLVVAFISQIIIFGFYGVRLSYAENVEIVLWFTAVSLIRSYVLRRVFTRITE